jgi:hypothetical protein
MAIKAENYFNNAIVGTPQVGNDVEVHESHKTPRYALGTKYERQDGSVFRYAQFGADTAAGELVSADLSETSTADTDNSCIAPASAVAVAGENIQPGDIGSHYVEVTLAAITADQFAGAYFVTTDDTGEGYTYRIKGNTATDNPASGNIRIELYKPIVVAVDATTDFAIQGSPYNNVEAATSTDFAASGVAMSAITIADAAYGWVCTKGVIGILQDGAITAGNAVIVGTVAGSVAVASAATDNVLGYCLIAGDDTGQGVFDLDVE